MCLIEIPAGLLEIAPHCRRSSRPGYRTGIMSLCAEEKLALLQSTSVSPSRLHNCATVRERERARERENAVVVCRDSASAVFCIGSHRAVALQAWRHPFWRSWRAEEAGVCKMHGVAMKAAVMPSASSSAASPSSFFSSRPSNGALAVQRWGAGEVGLVSQRGSYGSGVQQRAVSGKRISWQCAATTEGKQVGVKSQMLVYVPPHPLIKHWVSILRNEFSPPPMFRSAMAELGRVLIYEASRDWLLTVSGEVNTPCGVAEVEFIDPREPVKVVPVLRAGLVLVEQVGSVLPATQTYHLGFARNEETLEPSIYLNKLPERFEDGARVLVADPMLATGGTIVAALEEVTKRGADVSLIRVVAAVAAPPALKLLSEKFPGLKVYVGIIDEELNSKGYIVPGFGDAGDRSFGTS